MTEDARNGRRPLEGLSAIVTGGASGIGYATCRRLSREGVRLALVDLDLSKAEAAAKRLIEEEGGDAIGLALDVRDEKDMDEMASRALEKFGRVDVLVHSAGILHIKGSQPRMLAEISTEEWDQILDTNLRGTFLANRAVARVMIKQRSGQIVNISSVQGRKGQAFDSAYCASKFGVIGLTESLAEEVRSYGIRVFVICPGAVATPLWDQNGPIGSPAYALPPERVADLVTYVLAMPQDAILQNIVITPFKARKRKKAADPDKKPGAPERSS